MRRHGKLVVGVVAVLAATGCAGGGSGPGEPELSFAPVDRLSKVEVWDARTGWRELPRAAVRAPAERWRIPVPGDLGGYEARDGVVAVLDDAGGTVTVRRIDPATGADLWRVPVPGVAMPAELDVDAGGSLITVKSTGSARGSVLLDGVDGRIAWRSETTDGLDLVGAVGDLIIVSDVRGTQAIERGTGVVRWQSAGLLTVSTPVLLRDDVVNKVIGVVDPQSGTELWQVPRREFSDPHAIGDTLLITQDEDGSLDSITAHDLRTGAQRWRTEEPDLGRTVVTAIDDETVMISGSGGPGVTGTAVVSLKTGAVLWRPDRDATALRVDGKPYVLTERGAQTLVHHGTTGEVVSSARLPDTRASMLAGGALYRAEREEIAAIRLPELVGQWRSALPGQEPDIGAVPGGFVLKHQANGTTEVTGYLE